MKKTKNKIKKNPDVKRLNYLMNVDCPKCKNWRFELVFSALPDKMQEEFKPHVKDGKLMLCPWCMEFSVLFKHEFGCFGLS
jgi:hypothetical protein